MVSERELCVKINVLILFLLVAPVLFFSQQDSVLKIKVRSSCKCPISCYDSIKGPSTLKIDLTFEKGLEASDFECFGFRLWRENCVVACIRNADSVDYFFYALPHGVYTVEFFADGYYCRNNGIVLRHNDENKTDYFIIGKKQLPQYLKAVIKERRKKRGHTK